MSEIIATNTKQDYLGEYTEYVYADGRVETDPPARPASREDAQRERLSAIARAKTKAMLEARKTRKGIGSAPYRALEANYSAAQGHLLYPAMVKTLSALAALARTVRVPRTVRDVNVENYELGGEISTEDKEYGYKNEKYVRDGEGMGYGS